MTIEPVTVRIRGAGDGRLRIEYDCGRWTCAGEGTVAGDAIDFWITTDSRYGGRREGEGLMRGTATHGDAACRAETDWTAVKEGS